MYPDTIRSTFRFIQWQDLYLTEKPFQVLTQIPPNAENQRVSNLIFKDEEVEIRDVHSLPIPPTLDTYGFMFRKHALTFRNFASRQAVEEHYFPEVERLIRQEVDDVGHVFIFDWRLRNTQPESPPGTVLDFNDRTSFLRPAIHFHVDQSPAGVLNRIMCQLEESASQLLKDRVRVINIWRPLVKCIGDWPLALCDGSTADPSDFIETDHIRRHYTGSSMYMQRRQGQRFYYLSGQGEDDVLFLKIFDSKKKGIKAPYCPHASFRLPYKEPRGVPRQSIEVRCLVFSSKAGNVPLGYHQQVKTKFNKDDEVAD